MPSSLRSRSVHWAAPFLVAGVIALAAFAPTLSAGASTPSLARLTPAQLLVKAQHANVKALSGNIRLTANLGLPDLSSLAGAAGRDSAFNPLDLLSGSHGAHVWIDGPQRQRIALPSSLAETDVIHNGADVWTWMSSGSQVTHLHSNATPKAAAPDAAPRAGSIETPDQVAAQVLAAITPSTSVTVTTPDYVADRPVYELVLRPNARQSTVDHIGIAVDSASGLPLQVSLFAKGQRKPALQLGFTSVSFDRPSASTFSFTPPPNAHVTTNGAGLFAQPAGPGFERRSMRPESGAIASPLEVAPAQPGQTKVVGHDWTSVVITSTSGALPAQAGLVLKAAVPVSGAWGSGRLLQTSLVNILLLSDGRMAAGAVTPAALEAAVASAP